MRLLLTILLFGAFAVQATPTITLSRIQQRYPWNGLVDIDYTVAGIGADEDANDYIVSLAVSATTNSIPISINASNFVDCACCDLPSANGTHRITWDSAADGADFQTDGATFRLAISKLAVPESAADYMIIDVSSGSKSSQYPARYVHAPGLSSAQFNSPQYKSSKIVLKRVTAGTFQMGANIKDDEAGHTVRLTKDFLLCLFTVTQRQCELAYGSCNATTDRTAYSDEPASMAPYRPALGSALSGVTLYSKSGPISNLNARVQVRGASVTGFDLPTEAQKEYACRAGTTTRFYWGNDKTDTDALSANAWWSGNWNSHIHAVGGRLPNAWGFYDMQGNTLEFCHDWADDYSADPAYVEGGVTVDPMGPPNSDNSRRLRGGSGGTDLAQIQQNGSFSSGYRSATSTYSYSAFRMARTLSTGGGSTNPGAPVECAHSSLGAIRLDVRQGAVRAPEHVDQIQDIALNSDTNWVAGGVSGVSSTVNVWTASADDENDPSTWIKGSCTVLGSVTGEGTLAWTPPQKGYYWLELVVGDEVRTNAFMNLSETGGLKSLKSIGDATVTYTADVRYTAAGSVPGDIVVTMDSETLVEGTDYTVTASDNDGVGVATLTIKGIGNYKDSVEKNYNVIPAVPIAQDVTETCAPLDARTNDVLTLRGRQWIVWNSSELFAPEPRVWTIGGSADAEASVSFAPMAGPDAEPDESRRRTVKTATGEGSFRCRYSDSLFFHAKMEVLTNGVPRAGSLTRIIRLTRPGLVIFF